MVSEGYNGFGKSSEPYFLPIDPQTYEIVNCEFMRTEACNYPHKTTPYGDVKYSPRYHDEKYTYRHVMLPRDGRKAAERLAAKNPNGLLTESQIINDLYIDLTPGWEHFMKFKGRLKELILRRPLVKNEKKNIIATSKQAEFSGNEEEKIINKSNIKKRSILDAIKLLS